MAAPTQKKKRGRKDNKIEPTVDSESSEFESSDDSDTEVQNAFTRGELKPGLNVELEEQEKEFINDVQGMKNSLSKIKQKLPWVERLDMQNDPAPESDLLKAETAHEVDINDDFKRELLFYRQAQTAVLEALPKLRKLNIPTKRPDDYFAQMAKTDPHMKKVRENLMSKKLSMERSEKAKKIRELRKYGKKVQQEVLLNRQKQKREMMDAVKKFRKGQKDKLDFLDDDKPGKQKPGQSNKKGQPKVNKKREYRDKKFGFGGQKKRGKRNTAESFASEDGHGGGPRGGNKKNKKGAAQIRPGKARRNMNKKNKRRRY